MKKIASYTVECNGITEPKQISTLNKQTEYVDLSTTYIALVPKMTSMTEPSGEVKCSDTGDEGYRPYNAFNSSDSPNIQGFLTFYEGKHATLPVWLQYEFPSAKVVKEIEYNPFGFYYKDGTNYVGVGNSLELRAANTESELSNESSIIWSTTSGHTINEIRKYKVNNNSAYKFYRLYLKNTHTTGGYPTPTLGISFLQYYGK